MFDLEQAISKISSNPLFLQLKNIVENAEGWHDEEAVFDHCVKTANIAKRENDGEFIKDLKSREIFIEWMNRDIFGLKQKDISILSALLHDSGKILVFSEQENNEKLITKRPGFENQTLCPGHEYYGGTIVVPTILKGLEIREEAVKRISDIVRLHGSLNDPNYYATKKDWKIEEIIHHVKSQAEGLYIEELFNAYCDCYDAQAFKESKEMIEGVFNFPDLYIPRKYSLPSL